MVTTATRSTRNTMNANTISTEKTTPPEPGAPQPKGKRTPAKKAKPAKKTAQAKKAGKPEADCNNKKAEVIAMMKRAKGATLAEIMSTTEWQAHTVRGFVSILGSKGGEKIDSSKNPEGTDVQDREIASGNSLSKRRLGSRQGGVPASAGGVSDVKVRV